MCVMLKHSFQLVLLIQPPGVRKAKKKKSKAQRRGGGRDGRERDEAGPAG